MLFLILFSILPRDDYILRDSVDLVETNHFYDGEGRFVFDRIIWWDWDTRYNRHKVVAWRLVKEDRMIHPENIKAKEEYDKSKGKDSLPFVPKSFGHPIFPVYDRQRRMYISIFFDNDKLRLVTAKSKLETYTQYDPELIDREFYDKNKRRDLRIK